MNRQSTIFRSLRSIFLAGCVLTGLASCASIKTESVPGKDPKQLRTFYVERLEGEESGLHTVIAQELALRGLTASAGEKGGAPKNVDALVNYYDRWFWDMTPYLLKLDIMFLDPDTRSLIARGESYRPSLQRKEPRDMVKEVLDAMLR